jgi:hypothetical protein
MNHLENLLNSQSRMDELLYPFLFPVEERNVSYEFHTDRLFPETRLRQTEQYKAIVRSENNRLISIMPKTYQLITNEEVILPVLKFLDNIDNKWLIDPSHSFVDEKRMRLQITFPELTVDDGTSEVALSLFLHNSYNGVEGVRGFWGGIRAICTNGMVFGKLLGSFYHRHTSGIDLEKLRVQLESTSSKLPVIAERIKILQSIETNSKQLKEIETHLGKTAFKYVEQNFKSTESQYVLLNVATHFISHFVQQHLRANYQRQISYIFGI